MGLIDETLLALLVCPRCRGALEELESESVLRCGACRVRYSVHDGVPNMIINEATADPVDTDPKG